MTKGLERYLELLDVLLWKRAVGNPNDETEADFAVALNDCRPEMTSLCENKTFPLKVLIGDISFQVDLDLALAPGWRQELEYLLHHALAVRV